MTLKDVLAKYTVAYYEINKGPDYYLADVRGIFRGSFRRRPVQQKTCSIRYAKTGWKPFWYENENYPGLAKAITFDMIQHPNNPRYLEYCTKVKLKALEIAKSASNIDAFILQHDGVIGRCQSIIALTKKLMEFAEHGGGNNY